MSFVLQRWLCVTPRIYGIHDKSRDRECPVEHGGGECLPCSYIGRETIYHCPRIIRSKYYQIYDAFPASTQYWGLSLTSVTVLCPWAKHINPCLVPVQSRKTHPDITENCWIGLKESNQTNTVLGHHHSASKTPFKWRFAGWLMVAHFYMFTVLALQVTGISSLHAGFSSAYFFKYKKNQE